MTHIYDTELDVMSPPSPSRTRTRTVPPWFTHEWGGVHAHDDYPLVVWRISLASTSPALWLALTYIHISCGDGVTPSRTQWGFDYSTKVEYTNVVASTPRPRTFTPSCTTVDIRES
jgi:hypothetical protein